MKVERVTRTPVALGLKPNRFTVSPHSDSTPDRSKPVEGEPDRPSDGRGAARSGQGNAGRMTTGTAPAVHPALARPCASDGKGSKRAAA